MIIRDIMSSPVYIIAPDENIARARKLMLKHGIGRLVIMEGEKPIGIVTKKDISRRLDQAEPQWRRRPIDNIPIKIVMTEGIIPIYPEASPKQAAEIMIENNVSGLPVLRGEKKELIGIVTKWDLIRFFSEQDISLKVKDLNFNPAVVVHRHHTISHIIYELERNSADRAVVLEDNNSPVGIITHSNLAFTELLDFKGELPGKDVKMVRKRSHGGEKRFRYIREVPLVAEDIMSTPLITIGREDLAVVAAGIMVRERINGIPIVDDRVLGLLSGDHIIRAIISIEG